MAKELTQHGLNESNWGQVTQEVRKKWTKLNEADLERIEHDFNALTDLVSLKTGLTHEETEQRLDDIIARCGTQTTMNAVESENSWKQGNSQSSSRSAGTLDSGTIEDDSEEQAP
ncbi:hypothetical protein B9G69_009365 [Bdellovibrio sp. SKB1291214]|uniref:hypothetical protein n=1 Tax=Bdellovibrio sp. SKB1291214 TaxID=1732569 RepID=UPI000B51AEAA|nr:hypothetical protein [Bdellovibrio sp. SKB1291214]UYL07254.1 hypothetical protein B9G69_009365 [Bdellovibrio sp. SKB1291214]